MTLKTSLTALVLASLLAGCANGFLPRAHRHAMQQGNLLERADIDRVQVGMSAEQVRYLLGSPVIANLAGDDQWLYTFSAGKLVEPGEPQLLAVSFANGRVVALDDQYKNEASLQAYRRDVASDFD